VKWRPSATPFNFPRSNADNLRGGKRFDAFPNQLPRLACLLPLKSAAAEAPDALSFVCSMAGINAVMAAATAPVPYPSGWESTR
jgi:hypothetical protein